MKPLTKTLTLSAIFTALIVIVGYALLHVPNVELLLATAFLAGMVLGPRRGFVVGGVGEFLYALLNPVGVSALPQLVSQVFGVAIIGFAGGIMMKYFAVHGSGKKQITIFAVCGFCLTALFDFLTTLGFLIMTGVTFQAIFAAYSYGAPFYIAHMAVNTLVFALLLPLVYRSVAGKFVATEVTRGSSRV